MTNAGKHSTGDHDAGPRETREATPDELRGVLLFEDLRAEQLAELCRAGRIETVPRGTVYREGDPADCFYVLIEGAVVTTRKAGGDEVEVNRTDRRGFYGGSYRAYLGDLVPPFYVNSMRVTAPSVFYVIPAAEFARVMREWSPMAVHLLEGLYVGVRGSQQAVDQRERLLALGSLSAGLTHELNNPATAAVRAAEYLRVRVSGMREKLPDLARSDEQREALEALVRLQRCAVEQMAVAPRMDALAASDAEDELADWFDEHGIEDGWELAPALVQSGLGTDWLDQVRDAVHPSKVEAAVRYAHYAVATELLMTEIEDAVTRISTLVGAVKQYSQLDRAPFQEADVHGLLDSTLLMLSGKIPGNVKIVKEYDRTLPKVPCYAAELNQVWTNIIDNAVAAMGDAGTLTIRTTREDDHALVEFGDTGPGIPADYAERIFEPFFTTKPVGEGTGLGLDISYRIVVNKHHGDLRVESKPGDTRFQVLLPLQAAKGSQ